MNNKGFTLTELIIALFFIVVCGGGIWGWILNIVKIVGSNFEPITGMLVMRCIGVFVAPLGAVLGFM